MKTNSATSADLRPLRKHLLEGALRYYRQVASENDGDATAREELSRALIRVAEITGEIGSPREAIAAYEQAIDLSEKLAPSNPSTREQLGRAYAAIALLLKSIGAYESAEQGNRKAIALFRALAEASPGQFEAERTLANALANLGSLYSVIHREEEALPLIEESIQIKTRLAELAPDSIDRQLDLAAGLNVFGIIQQETGKDAEALATMRKAVSIRRGIASKFPNDANIGMALAHTGQSSEPRNATQPSDQSAWRTRGSGSVAAVTQQQPSVVAHQRDLALFCYNLANYLSNEPQRGARAGRL